MNSNKTRTDFMLAMTRLEGELADFQRKYPVNYGEMFRRYFGLVIISIAVCLGIMGDGSYDFYTVVVFVGIAGMMIFFKRFDLNLEHAEATELNNQFSQLNKDYGEYPDVKQYLKEFRDRATAAITKKRRTKQVFTWICVVLFLACATAVIATRPSKEMSSNIVWFAFLAVGIWIVVSALNSKIPVDETEEQ